MKLYKLTDGNSQTMNKTQWGENVTHSGTGKGRLCGPGYIHAYEHPLLAAFLHPIHVGFHTLQLWEAEGEVAKREGQLKCGCVTLTTIKQIPLPLLTTEMRLRFGILCALEVYKVPFFVTWANKWLSGEDRSLKGRRDVANAANEAAYDIITYAVTAAANAITATNAADYAAGDYAAAAAYAAVTYIADLNLIALAEKAVKNETIHNS